MKIIPSSELEQGSLEWKQKRLGKISGTRLKSAIGSPAVQETLLCELLSEVETEQPKDMTISKAMERGTAEEAFAIKHYEKLTGTETKEVGMCLSDEYDWLILSPDRLVEIDGVIKGAVEAKSPNSDTMMKYRVGVEIHGKGIPAEYFAQVLHYFIVIDTLDWLDFIIYDERYVRKDMKMLKIRVTREDLEGDIVEAYAKLMAFKEKWDEWKEILLANDF